MATPIPPRRKPEKIEVVKRRFRVLVGVNYPDPLNDGEQRAEPGEVVDDLPANAVDQLLADGVITEVN